MTLQEEQNIIQRVLGGDVNAFGNLVLANQSRVYNLALKMLKNREDALDISQEAFVRAYKAMAGFQADSRFSVWLYKITYNLCIDFLRKNANAKTLSLDDTGDNDDDRPSEIPDVRHLPEDSLLRRELRKSIADGINSLPRKHRDILVMREITGMGYEDIADALCISSGTVKSRLARARLKLLKILEDKGTLPEQYRLKTRDSKSSAGTGGEGVE